MATVTTYRCDVCLILKGEANHWYRAQVLGSGAMFCLSKWDIALADKEPEFHLCGLGCAMKFMEQSLGGKQ